MNNLNTKFEYKKLSPEEMSERNILGRLVGKIASWKEPTRNGRRYSKELWKNVLNDPIFQEKIRTKSCFGQLEHPVGEDQSTDPNKICICLAELPKIMDDGYVYGVFDILDTPMGHVVKTMLDYGTQMGVSSRGSGDLFTDYDGQESVDPNTYDCVCFDAVTLPAMSLARLTAVNESLDGNKKSLKEALDELVDNADEKDKAVMKSTIDSIYAKDKAENEEDIENKEEEKIPTAKVNEALEQGLDIQKIMDLSVDDNSSIDKTNDGCNVCLRGKDLKNDMLLDYLDSQACATFDKALSSSKCKVYTCKCKLTFTEALKGKTVEVVYLDKDGEEHTTHFECDRDYRDTDSKQLEIAVKANDRDIDEVVKITESLEKDELNDVIEKLALDFEGLTLSAKDFNAIVKALAKVTNPDPEDEGSYDFVEPLQFTDGSNAVKSNEVDDVKSVDSDIIDELQETLSQKHDLEEQVVKLQEKLSVCYAKESLNEEQITKFKKAIANLTTRSSKLEAMEEKVSKLNEELESTKLSLGKELEETKTSLQESKDTISRLKRDAVDKRQEIRSLNESVTTRNSEVNKLTESFKKKEKALNESILDLKEQLLTERNSNSEKLEKTTALLEKYKKIAKSAVDKYVENKAVQIGVSVNEIKNRLPKSYTFDDINSICEGLQEQKLSLNRLPFRASSNLNEGMKVSVKTQCTSDNILPKENPNNTDDNIDGWLGQYLGR